MNAVMGANGGAQQFAAKPGTAALVTKNKPPTAGMSCYTAVT